MNDDAQYIVIDQYVVSSRRSSLDLFLVSLLILFMELAFIRWFPAHVVYLTFFTNTVLLACFLGMSVGCLAANAKRRLLGWTPWLLAGALGIGLFFGVVHSSLEKVIAVGAPASPQLVYFGTDYHIVDLAQFYIPVEILNGFFFLMIAFVFLGPGQELGRAFRRVPDRVRAYSINILGSIVGIILFAAFSWLQLAPTWWFLPPALILTYFLGFERISGRFVGTWNLLASLFLVLLLPFASSATSRQYGLATEHFWSPYYRVDYNPPPYRHIGVNLIAHQMMVSRSAGGAPAYAYVLPYVLNRDSGGHPLENVLIIGAGSGNDVSRALEWGAKHVDAVEIDPVILKLGIRDHPDRPYQDPRVSAILDDGRNFLQSTKRSYDLIVYARLDSLVLHSSYSNIRLESYLFTREAFEDVRRRLKPDGLFVVSNYFRYGWLVARLEQLSQSVFREVPLVIALPYRPTVESGPLLDGFTIMFAGNTAALQTAFEKHPEYWLKHENATPSSPNGFAQNPPPQEQSNWERFGLARVVSPGLLRVPSDDWPFLYLHKPMVPTLHIRGILLMAGLALLMIYAFQPQRGGFKRFFGFDGRMFFLGAGFMLIETKAVVHMALLFGSTWMVNTFVFLAVLLMILAANLWVLRRRPGRLWPYYAGLFVALVLNTIVPLDYFLGMDRLVRIIGSCLLVFAPILFAAVVFAVSFGHSAEPERDFGANIAGAMFGGLSEYTSMLLGFQYLVLVAFGLYLLSALTGRKPVARPH